MLTEKQSKTEIASQPTYIQILIFNQLNTILLNESGLSLCDC